MTQQHLRGLRRCAAATLRVAVLVGVAALAATGARAQPAPMRDPMQPPAAARSERGEPGAAAGATTGPAAQAAPALVPPRHLITVGGRRFVVDNGRRFGVGDRLGDARIEAIDDSWVTVREAGVATRLPLYGSATRAAHTTHAIQAGPAASRPEPNSNLRPARKGDLP